MNTTPQMSVPETGQPAGAHAALPRVIIDSAAPRGRVDLKELWAFHEVLRALILREIRVRYAQTAVGAGWVVLQPILTTGVLSVIASRWLSAPAGGVHYPLFVLSGLIPWMYFTHVLTKSAGSLISTGLLSKAYFPRLLLPLAVAVGGLIDMFVAGALLALMMLYYRTPAGVSIVLLPLSLLLIVLVVFGAGVWLAVMNLYYRDVMHALPFATQLGFFATPVAYPMALVPQHWRLLYSLNPLTGVVEIWRWTVFGTSFELSRAELALSLGVGAAVLFSGLWLFSRQEPVMADVGES